MPPDATPTKADKKAPPAKIPEILDVGLTAAFLTVSRDTVYELFQSGQLPGRKVGTNGSPPRPPSSAGWSILPPMIRSRRRTWRP